MYAPPPAQLIVVFLWQILIVIGRTRKSRISRLSLVRRYDSEGPKDAHDDGDDVENEDSVGDEEEEDEEEEVEVVEKPRPTLA